jgi:hypothetical protein
MTRARKAGISLARTTPRHRMRVADLPELLPGPSYCPPPPTPRASAIMRFDFCGLYS